MATITKRNDILEALKTRLSAITVAAGYNYTIAFVDRAFLSPPELGAASFPCLLITGSKTTKNRTNVHTGSFDYNNSLLVTVMGYVAGGAIELEKLIRDVEQAVESDEKFGGLAYQTNVVSEEDDQGSLRKDYGLEYRGCKIGINILYDEYRSVV